MLKDYLEKRWKEKRLEIHELFPVDILNMVGENNLMYKGNKIEWNMKYLGPTGYLDRIPLEIYQDFNILYGVDCYKRSFIFAKIKILSENVSEYSSISIFQRYANCDLYVEYSSISIFQRYANSDLYVSVEPQGKIYTLYGGQTAINYELMQKLTDVFHGGHGYSKYEDRKIVVIE